MKMGISSRLTKKASRDSRFRENDSKKNSSLNTLKRGEPVTNNKFYTAFKLKSILETECVIAPVEI